MRVLTILSDPSEMRSPSALLRECTIKILIVLEDKRRKNAWFRRDPTDPKKTRSFMAQPNVSQEQMTTKRSAH